jgi:hypothetical protein
VANHPDERELIAQLGDGKRDEAPLAKISGSFGIRLERLLAKSG